MAYTKDHPSELYAQLLSNNSLDPWVDTNTAPRKVMQSGHVAQALVIGGAEERYWQTGTEARFGEYTFGVSAPADIEINHIISRFPRSRTMGTTIKNPQTIVIYTEQNSSRKVGILDLRDNSLEHQYFSFAYRKTKAFHELGEGKFFEKGTPFLESPALKPGGGYGYGLNLMYANMSHPAVSDDSMMVSESAVKRMTFDVIETREGSWGRNTFLLNSFGDDKTYKGFRDVGEFISPDGRLMTTREYDERLSATLMGINDTRIIDTMYDKSIYTRPGRGEVIDIMVYHDNRSLPNGMNAQIEHYRDLTDSFYRTIIAKYLEIVRSHGGKPNISDEFHRLVVEACAMTDYPIDVVVQKLHHKAPIDDWRVEMKIKYTITPNIGNKGTGLAGNKGVIGVVVPDNEMPINEFGQRVDIIMSPESAYNRQNSGSQYEPYFNSVTREHLTEIRTKLDLGPDEQPSIKAVKEDMTKNSVTYEQVWDRLMHLYSILSPTMYDNYSSSRFDDPELRATHLSWLLRYPCIHILSPTHNMTAWRWAWHETQKHFKPRSSRLTYRGATGNWVTTDKPIEMGHMYFMILEKISDDWIAVPSAKVQHMQMLGQVTSSDKYSAPVKLQAVKALSESELRITAATCGADVATELLSRNNSLADHQEICYAVLSADEPTNIKRAIDRAKVPLGNNRALMLLKHILTVNGYKFVWKKYKDPDFEHRDAYIDKDRVVSFNDPKVADNTIIKRAVSKLRKAISNLRKLFQ